MQLLSAQPDFIITDEDGILIGSSGGTSLLTGGTEGQAPIVQGDGSVAWGAAGASSLSELDDWDTDTLVVPGDLVVRQSGGVAGTDELQIYHDGTDAHVVPQSGALYFTSAGANGPQVNSSGELANIGGGSQCTVYGVGAVVSATKTRSTSIGYNSSANGEGVALGTFTVAGSSAVAIGAGLSLSSSNRCFAADACTVIGYQAQSNFAQSVVIGRSARSTASYQLVVGTDSGFRIEDVYIGRGVTNATPSDTTYHATGGSGTDIAGASLYLAGGKGTGAGDGGSLIFQTAAAGASGSTLNTLTTHVEINSDGLIILPTIPTSNPGVSGALWSDGGTLKVS